MTTPQQYSPRSPDFLDTVAYTANLVDKILRNNPLTDAVISQGLMKWIGNYNDGSGNLINPLWIGEFLPADPNLPGSPPQKGFSLVRDDSRGGKSAIALYDATPGASAGLKQTLFIYSGDGQRMMVESRDGGQQWPEENVWMGALGSDVSKWPGTTSTASFDSLFEGRLNVQGNRVNYRVFCATTTGATANFRIRVNGPFGDVVGTTHSLGVNASGVFDANLDVTSMRGGTYAIRWDAQVTNGVGEARAQVISVRNFTP